MMTDRYENEDYLYPPRDIAELIKQKFKYCETYLSVGKAFIFYFRENSLNILFRYNVGTKTFYYKDKYYAVEEFRRLLNLLAFA